MKNICVGQICESVSKTFNKQQDSVILINTSDVLDGKILNYKEEPNLNLKGQFKKTFETDDILYSEIRPSNRRFAYVSEKNTEKYVASTKLMVIRAFKEFVDPKYLYLYLTSSEIVNKLQHLAETRSGTFPQITFSEEIAKLVINLPPIPIQKDIVNFINSIDNKINVNNQINKNLEEQAFSIYKEFLNTNEYSLGLLSEIADITMGQSPSGETYNETGKGSVFFQGRAEFGERFPITRLYTTAPKRMAMENDILMSVRAPVGDINIAIEPCCIGRGLAAIHSKNSHQSFLLYTMKSLKDQLDVFNGEGTVFGSINKDALNNLSIKIPDETIIDNIDEILSPLDLKIKNNFMENLALKNIRDSILPKLMSGEIDVASLEI
ncbi:restriction endonuclease subunit S [Succinivibrio sp.]|uniref:restriction endonuclease subunit S n=1 Tax=Succinivibrio sp. TaxID=2053619 RepID=UPI0025839B74|nr:restriction endonuclease subunit S [Succinivibrio sp.]MDD6206511.1 restriction endonuclease subunit S [Succinivibrio sp.]